MNTIPTWKPLLHGNVIHGWQVQAANADAARMMLESQMIEEHAFSLSREWLWQGGYVEPEGEGAVIPGSIPG